MWLLSPVHLQRTQTKHSISSTPYRHTCFLPHGSSHTSYPNASFWSPFSTHNNKLFPSHLVTATPRTRLQAIQALEARKLRFIAAQRRAMDKLTHSLHLPRLEEWYSTSLDTLLNHLDINLLRACRYSTVRVMETVYPEVQWLQHKFLYPLRRPRRRRNAGENAQLSASTPMDTQTTNKRKRGRREDKGISSVKPSISWGESLLRSYMRQILPYTQAQYNYKHPLLVHDTTGFRMELDVYYPEVRLALEYQGKQHYRNAFYQENHQSQTRRDSEKREACQKQNITLIEIPFWWDRSLNSLAATILEHRPDIALNITVTPTSIYLPIPATEPKGFRNPRKTEENPQTQFLVQYKYLDFMDPANKYVICLRNVLNI